MVILYQNAIIVYLTPHRFAIRPFGHSFVKLKLQSSQATLVRVALFGKKRSALLIYLIINNIAVKVNLVLRFVKEELSRSD